LRSTPHRGAQPHARGGRRRAAHGGGVSDRGTAVRADDQERDLRCVPDAPGVRAPQLTRAVSTALAGAGDPMNPTKTFPSADELARNWRESPRWRGISRGYEPRDVVRLRGTIPVEHSLARLTAEKLWRYLHDMPFVNALGALTGNQA